MRHRLTSITCVELPGLLRREAVMRIACACEATVETSYTTALAWWSGHIDRELGDSRRAAPMGAIRSTLRHH